MQNREFLRYVIRFMTLFAILYLGTYGFIGITSPGGYYFPFLDQHLNYINWLRHLLLTGSKWIVQVLGYTATLPDPYHVQINHANRVQLVYACLGYGVISFWIAFICVQTIAIITKIKWILIGFFLIVSTNMLRIAMILIANYRHWQLPFNIEHHFLYNVITYCIILIISIAFLKSKESKMQ